MNPEIETQIADLLLWRDPDARHLLEAAAKKHNVKMEAAAELLAWVRKVRRKGDKHGGMKQKLDKIFEQRDLWEK
ncbi:DNA modification system-associated small protein [Neisseria cinerea]|uniref:DNA modification system-associated small protein n=1 Tax=Neisseria cinerea TaxID=483 RepID=UPI000D3688AB|nr:DNA modification system-associated small protein [Neisseria cinerea]